MNVIQVTKVEAELFDKLPPGGSLSILREGWTAFGFDVRDKTYKTDQPPAEFVQACAPCENPTHKLDHRTGLPIARNPMELGPGMHVNTVSYVPCPDCRIELEGPCPDCGGDPDYSGEFALICTRCHNEGPTTLGFAYAVGEPRQTDDGKWEVELMKAAT